DGVWQLSDASSDVSENTEYDKMTIQTVDATSISMNNEDNDITLSKNKEISLMPGVSIKTADADELRYYIYKEVTIEGEAAADEAPEAETEAAPEEEAPVVETEAEVVEEVANETEAAEPAAAETEVAEQAAEAEPEAETNETAEPAPGFESVFALTGLLAVAYLVLGRRE
ncbi:MAG: S-layer protein domain-containing protein, partial [Methanothrix sp.]